VSWNPYHEGTNRKITMSSIKARIARLLTAEADSATDPLERT
jgi:hypothetical protein